ncbi:DEAD-domain-containing protein [Didymella exigua CBS 183.55]|uniref:RNA helicase n=1 Tax=Didymella exigua CBS 183.55 TaxID=1150837 RepID=A0A6A5R4G9_9PLEO|nr:DEAD-domain-containing protein [Didymella exigua CBS 183.55]KAF1922995.1 DEAD-domain-containing protein [Didymella exigua CBS 183.55]
MKRAHNPPKAAHKAHKRQKLEKASNPVAKKQKRRVQLHDLGWKTVGMPDRLEDTEGFYGLEEIDDVEVIKDATTGNITFQTTKTEEEVANDVEAAWKREEEEAARLEKMIGQEGKELPVEEEEAAEEEVEQGTPAKDVAASDNESFTGFSDDDETPAKKSGIEIEDLNPNSEIADGRTLTKDKVETKKEKPKTKKEKKAEAKARREEEQKLKQNTTANAGKPEVVETNPDYIEEEGVEADEDFEISGEGAFDILLNQPNDDDEVVDTSAWEELGLSEKVIGALAGLKFSKPSNIQASTIPEILAGRDLIGKASTGSGKTLAFGIPIVERYLATKPTRKEKDSNAPNVPTALIVAPTRELAHQITAHLNDLCVKGDFDAPSIATITGGLSVQKQRRQLEHADVVVGTPGRLWEVISSGKGLLRSLKQIKFLVLDEADRLLSQGHYQELGEILKVLDREDEEEEDDEPAPEVERQTLVFSATFSKGLQQKLAGKVKFGSGTGDIMNKADSMEYLLKKLNFREEQPRYIDANPESQMASKLREGLIECAGPEKDLYLYSLLLFHPNKRALIFTNSISAVRRLTPFLANLNLPALPLHSSMIQKARLRSIERFKERAGSILVATDVAARGLDIPKVDLVIHYHLPRAADTYVHRSGRTARADASGSSIIICAPEEVAGVRRLVAKVHAKASSAQAQTSKKRAYFIRTLDLDRRIVARLKPRATLSKKLADTVIAKEKKNSTDDMFTQAAADLGIDYDSEEFDKEAKGKKGRGAGRKKKEKSASEMTKAEFASIRHELRGLLAQRINTGVSARYLTSGGIDVEALIKGEGNTGFLGAVDGLGFDEDDEVIKPAPVQEDADDDDEDEGDGDGDGADETAAPKTGTPEQNKAKKQKSRKRNADGSKKKWIHH